MNETTREKKIYKVTIIGSIVNFILLIFKFLAGIFGHSSAMIADAAHSLSDFFSDIVVILFVRISAKPQDNTHDYGHGKFETLASLIVGLVLAVAGIGFFIDGFEKSVAFFKGESIEDPGWIAFAAALVSVIAKEGLFRYTITAEKKIHSPALAANAWHHRSDALTSIAVLIGTGGAIILGPKWRVLDPMAAVVVSVFIIKAAYSLMKPSLDELLEKSLPEDVKNNISEVISSIPGIMGMHKLRTRRIGSQIAIEAHITMDGHMSLTKAHAISSEVEKRLRKEFGKGALITLHMEPYNEE